jgi:hypothetical protein
MNTFLPHHDFEQSAACLDDRRLMNQRNEALIILKTLLNLYPEGKGWPNHPATRMWRGCEGFLTWYIRALCDEMHRRGINSGHADYSPVQAIIDAHDLPATVPRWWGDERLHASHRACLLAKDLDHYSQFGWREQPTPPIDGRWPYWWPTDYENKEKRDAETTQTT